MNDSEEWKAQGCADCTFNFDGYCRRHPPLYVSDRTYYPKIENEDSYGQKFYKMACAEWKKKSDD